MESFLVKDVIVSLYELQTHPETSQSLLVKSITFLVIM